MEIYVITAGEYSDYHICGVTTDKVKAEKIQKLFSNSFGGSQVETYEDGVFDDYTERGYTPFEVWLDKSGYITKIEKAEELVGKFPNLSDFSKGKFSQSSYWVKCFAKDYGHAEKIAHDMLAKYKAEQAGL